MPQTIQIRTTSTVNTNSTNKETHFQEKHETLTLFKPKRTQWCINCSDFASTTHNRIRDIVDHLKITPNNEKQLITLALGDPTQSTQFQLHPIGVQAVQRQLLSNESNGYVPAFGMYSTRKAIANYCSHPNALLQPEDVIVTSGCSGALELCISALAGPGKTILLPQPGFSIYETIAQSKGIDCKYYKLDPSRNWEIDLQHLESLIDTTTACIIVNNPSNPCGSVYSNSHLLDLLSLAEKHYVPILSDEIYGNMVFEPHTFHPLASLTTQVPILSVGGLAKQFMVPGWRLGWILIHDRNELLHSVRQALYRLSAVLIGANTLIQSAVPDILTLIPTSYHQENIHKLFSCASMVMQELKGLRCIQPYPPQGAMYMMLGINVSEFQDIPSDVEFIEKLMLEESVMCLPGTCFNAPNFVRIVICISPEVMKEACTRIRSFCSRHSKTLTP